MFLCNTFFPLWTKVSKMAQLECPIPHQACYVRNIYLYDLTPGIVEQDEFEGLTFGYIFGAVSVYNRPLRFHFQAENGALFNGLPISAFVHEAYEWPFSPLRGYTEKPMERSTILEMEVNRLRQLEIWDCESNDLAVTVFPFLRGKKMEARTRNGEWMTGTYLFTVKNYNGDASYNHHFHADDPDAKSFHFLELLNGNYGVFPNNHLRTHNPDFVKPYNLKAPPKYRPFQSLMTAEYGGKTAGDSDDFFYEHTEE